MTKLIKIILVGLLTLSSLNAKTIFDLQDQYFENAYKQDTKDGVYDLKDVQVHMANVYQMKSGEYVTSQKRSGIIKVKLKKNIQYFSVAVNAKYRSIASSGTSLIVITSNKGKQKTIVFEEGKISIGKNSFKIKNLYNTLLNILIKKTQSSFEIIINGQTFKKFDIKSFGALSSVKLLVNTGTSNYHDYLYDFSIISE